MFGQALLVKRGDIFTLGQRCQHPPPGSVDFTRDNAYYVSPKMGNAGVLDPLATADQ
jgi:hypothetical protein